MSSNNDAKSFTCVCGKIYCSPQSFNGHKAHCRTHLLAKCGEAYYAEYCIKQLEKTRKAVEGRKAASRLRTDQSEFEWKSVDHYCERCGKLMSKKYGSGRFCSKFCANSKQHSNETKGKISASAKIKGAVKHKKAGIENIQKYYDNPNYCCICNNKLSFKQRFRKTCNKECLRKLHSLNVKERIEAGLHNGWNSRNIRSYAEKFWENVLLNNQINFESEFKITTAGTKYFLDFKIEPFLDLEIDGMQHLHCQHQEHDKIRDANLKALGYVVYRIPYVNPKKSDVVKKQIQDFLAFYEAYISNY